MNVEATTHAVLALLTALFLTFAVAFRKDLWAHPETHPVLPPVEGVFTNPATVRVSLPELIRRKEDVSAFECNSCHEINKPGKLEFDAEGHIVLPAGHADFVMQHGRNHRNENCYNCHDEANHTLLRRRDNRKVKLEESTQLCAGCHGPNYRDWGVGIHGRTSGYRNREMGPITRRDCVDCHNPHSPAFPQIKPAPGPHALHAEESSKSQTPNPK